MSENELLDYCLGLYKANGIGELAYPQLKKHKTLYFNLYSHGLKQKEVISRLGLVDEYRSFKENLPGRWSWIRIVQAAQVIAEQEGVLPPAGWFQGNGHGSLIQAVYYLGHTWEDVRDAVGDFSGSSFVESRNGMRWRSHPEASMSNFLYARGIEHKRGKRYPVEYAEHSDAKYAYFDLHFIAKDNVWVDVEIWGDKPNGHAEEKYQSKRQQKESFNVGNPNFLGIHFSDCFDELVLTKILSPHIGVIKPFQFDKPTDQLIHTTHWSNADELLAYCRHFVSTMPDGAFPTEEWLRKRGKWKHRDGETYNTLSIYIKTWLGGIRNLRKLLDQGHVSTATWDEASATGAYRQFFVEHGMTPSQARHLYRKRDSSISAEVAKYAANISHAVEVYAGGAKTVNQKLGIDVKKITR